MTDIREDIRARLKEMGEASYGDFTAKLTPGIDRERFIGVRMPKIRALAKEMSSRDDKDLFYEDLPHSFYEEDMLHSAMLCLEKVYERALSYTEAFLPYINNWATSDCLHPKAFEKNRDRLLPELKKWMASERTFTVRVGVDQLMSLYLDRNFDPEYLRLPASVTSDEYYVKMMIAWFYATALAKQWNDTIPYLENGLLSVWVHNKTIQKAVESYRITDEQKEYLKTLRRKK